VVNLFALGLALTVMEILVSFPGGKKVDATFGGHVVNTDQALSHGGGGTAPEPFELFLASLATCAGIFVLGFCQTRNIATEGIQIVQHHRFDEASHRLERVELELVLPASFPDKYRVAVARAAEGCKVKKTLTSPPEVGVVIRTLAT
jgi:putative redox protein